MSQSHNTLLEVASLSLRFSRKFLTDYSHAKSPKKFTEAQLMSCLVLKAYRGIVDILDASHKLQKRLGLERLPHYSTLKYFADRSHTLEIIDAILTDVVKEYGGSLEEVSIDSTGLETTSASAHYKTRSGKKRKKYVKLSLCVLAGTMLPAGVVVSWGPYNDKREAPALFEKIRPSIQPQRLFADAGYDAEWVHEFCRDEWSVESFMPPAVHRRDGGVNGKYRSQMTRETLKENGYGRLWLVESFMSGLKRTTGSTLRSRKEQSLFVEAGLRVLAYAFRL